VAGFVTLRCYIASASAEFELCARYRDRLRVAGVEVTHDWMETVRANPFRSDRDLSRQDRIRIAAACANGVVSADVFWLLLPANRTTIGAWVELGIAYGSARPKIVVSGPWQTAFTDLADQFTEHEHAFDHVVDLAEIASIRGARLTRSLSGGGINQ
jgi:hypothetical protein